MTTRLYAWSRAHTFAIDAGVAACLVLVLGPLSLAARGMSGLVFSVLSLAPLAVRRRWPVGVLLFVVGVSLAQVAVLPGILPANVAQPLVLYTVAAHVSSFRIRLLALGFGLLGSVLASIRLSEEPSRSAVLTDSVFLAVFMVLVWVVGNLVRGREAIVEELRAANGVLEREREQRDVLAAQRERVRIARDVHDIVAHSLSVVVVQADGAAYAATHATGWRPDAAAEALTAIGQTARGALSETRAVVAVLRDEEVMRPDEVDRHQAVPPGLDGIVALIDAVRSAGLSVDATIEPADAGEVGEQVSTTAYRVVQEGLTNVLKHAGPDASGSVHLERVPGALRVTVADDGGGAALDPGDYGSGLTGMRERVLACGGQFVAGPRTTGGFAVTATLPVGRAGAGR